MTITERAFKQALLEAVEEGLLSLGESGRKAVYFHLQNTFSVNKEEIPNNPKAFSEGLQRIFGLGASVIEKAIIKSLYRKLGVEYEEKKDYNFLAYIDDAKQMVIK